MKKLTKNDILNAAEWHNKKENLNSEILNLNNTCKHWVVKETDEYVDEKNCKHVGNFEICEFCEKIFTKSENKQIPNSFYENQKKLFEYKYNLNR